MIDVTPEQIAAAKGNDIDAITAIVKATDERVQQLARKYATTSGRTDTDLAEDLAQIGRTAVWQCLERFEGTDVAQFFTFMDRTVSGALSDARRAEQRQGVSVQAAKVFETALRMASGDPYEAQRIATTAEAMGDRKMSPEAAYAARLSWQGLEYLDAPVYDGMTLGAYIEETQGVSVDLLEPSDRERARRQAIREDVHTTLGHMGAQAANILRATYGVAPVGFYGTENDDALATDFGIVRDRVRGQRVKAKARFESLYRVMFLEPVA